MLPVQKDPPPGFGTAGSGMPEIALFVKSVREVRPAGPRDGAPPLILAAAEGGVPAVRVLLQREDGLNAATGCGKTPLHWAVARGARGLLHSLRALSARCGLPLALDAANARGATPLHYAATVRDAWALDRLLAAGAAVDFRDAAGRTPLAKAAYWDDPAPCRRLLDAGADVAAADARGRTALHAAAAGGGAAAARALLERGADRAAADGAGRTPLLDALRAAAPADGPRLWSPAAACVLLPDARYARHVGEEGRAETVDEMGRSELHWAAVNGTDCIVRHLLALGASSRLRDNEGMTPLMCAMRARNDVTVKVLLEAPHCHPADVDAGGRSALHWAAQSGLWWAVEHLLAAGWSPWAPDGEGRDALMLALASREPRAADAVLRRAAYRQRAADCGGTALHYAVLADDARALLALLRAGADPDAIDLLGRTPLSCARHRGAGAMVDVLCCYATKSLMMPHTM